jgi:hypothetical protein
MSENLLLNDTELEVYRLFTAMIGRKAGAYQLLDEHEPGSDAELRYKRLYQLLSELRDAEQYLTLLPESLAIYRDMLPLTIAADIENEHSNAQQAATRYVVEYFNGTFTVWDSRNNYYYGKLAWTRKIDDIKRFGFSEAADMARDLNAGAS